MSSPQNLRCTTLFGKPYLKTLETLNNLKSVSFIGISSKSALEVLNHLNASNIESLGYYSSSGFNGKGDDGKDLEAIICRSGLISLSVNCLYDELDNSHLMAIRKAGLMNPNIKHLKIGSQHLKTSHLKSIFEDGNYSQLETLVIENISGDLTIEQFKYIEHLKLKRFCISGLRVSDNLIDYMKKLNWFESITQLGFHTVNVMTNYQVQSLLDMIQKDIEEFDMTTQWSTDSRKLFIQELTNRLNQFKKLERLFIQPCYSDDFTDIHQSLGNPDTQIILPIIGSISNYIFLDRISKFENVHIYQNVDDNITGNEIYQSKIRLVFPEEIDQHHHDSSNSWVPLAIITAVGAISLYMKYF